MGAKGSFARQRDGNSISIKRATVRMMPRKTVHHQRQGVSRLITDRHQIKLTRNRCRVRDKMGETLETAPWLLGSLCLPKCH